MYQPKITPIPTGFIYGPVRVDRLGASDETVTMTVVSNEVTLTIETHKDGRMNVDIINRTQEVDING